MNDNLRSKTRKISAGHFAGAALALTAFLGGGQYPWSIALITPLILLGGILVNTGHAWRRRRFRIPLLLVPPALIIAWVFIQLTPLPEFLVFHFAPDAAAYRGIAGIKAAGARITYDAYSTRNYLLVLLDAYLLLWVCASTREPFRDFYRVAGWLAVLITVGCAFGVAHSLGGDFVRMPWQPPSVSRRFSAFFENSNHFGFWLGVSAPPALFFFREKIRNSKENSGRKSLFIFLIAGFVLLAAVSLVMTLSRGAVISVVISGMAAMLLFRRELKGRRESFWAFFILAGLVAFMLATIDFGPLLARLGSSGTSLQNRMALWKGGLRLLRNHPMTGVGALSFTQAFRSFSPPGMPLDWLYAHNYYITAAAEFGLPAIALFAVTAAYWLFSTTARFKRTRSSSRKSLLGVVFISLVFAALHSTVDAGLQIPLNLFIIVALAGLAWSEATMRGRLAAASGNSGNHSDDAAGSSRETAGEPQNPGENAAGGSGRIFEHTEWRLTSWKTILPAGLVIAVISFWMLRESARILRSDAAASRLFSPREGRLVFSGKNGKREAELVFPPAGKLNAALGLDPLDALTPRRLACFRIDRLRLRVKETGKKLKALEKSTQGAELPRRAALVGEMKELRQETARANAEDIAASLSLSETVLRLRPADRKTWEIRLVAYAERVGAAVERKEKLTPGELAGLAGAAVTLGKLSPNRPDLLGKATDGLLLLQSFIGTDEVINDLSRQDYRYLSVALLAAELSAAPNTDRAKKEIERFLEHGIKPRQIADALADEDVRVVYGAMLAFHEKSLDAESGEMALILLDEHGEKLSTNMYAVLFARALSAQNRLLAARILKQGFSRQDTEHRIRFYNLVRRSCVKGSIHASWGKENLKKACEETGDVLLIAHDSVSRGQYVIARELLLSSTGHLKRNIIYFRLQARISLFLREWEAAKRYAREILAANPADGEAKSILQRVEAGRKKYGDNPPPVDVRLPEQSSELLPAPETPGDRSGPRPVIRLDGKGAAETVVEPRESGNSPAVKQEKRRVLKPW